MLRWLGVAGISEFSLEILAAGHTLNGSDDCSHAGHTRMLGKTASQAGHSLGSGADCFQFWVYWGCWEWLLPRLDILWVWV